VFSFQIFRWAILAIALLGFIVGESPVACKGLISDFNPSIWIFRPLFFRMLDFQGLPAEISISNFFRFLSVSLSEKLDFVIMI